MNAVLLRTSPALASSELSEVAANDDSLAPALAVVTPLLPAAPQPVAVATSRPDAANSNDDDYLGGYAGI